MKTMTAEKTILLIVPGSHEFEELSLCRMFGVVAGSFGRAIMADDEEALQGTESLREFFGTMLTSWIVLENVSD
jgi:hypothetical protein